MLLSVVVIATDGVFKVTNGIVYAVFLGCIVLNGVIASSFSKIMGKLQTVFVVLNFVLTFATTIALPIGSRGKRNDAKVSIFTSF